VIILPRRVLVPHGDGAIRAYNPQNNFASRTECFKCNTPKDPNAPTVPGDAFPQQAHGGGNFGNDQVRDGDWSCPACNINNFASRVACFKCSAPKPV
jgi:hypothetical protein